MCQIPDLRRVEPKHNIESGRNVRGQTFSNKTVIYASMVIKNVLFHMWVPEKKESCHMKVVTSTRSRDLAPQDFFTVGSNEDNGMHEQVSHHELCQRKYSTKTAVITATMSDGALCSLELRVQLRIITL